MKYSLGKVLIALSVISLSASAMFLFWLYGAYVSSGPLKESKVIIIPKGKGTSQVAELLETKKIINNKYLFLLSMTLWNSDCLIKAGEFLIPDEASPRDVLLILGEGKTLVRKITIAEGLTTSQILRKLEKIDGLVGGIPTNLVEGELLPETYHFTYGDSRTEIIQRMQKKMLETVNELWHNRKQSLPFMTPMEAVILASIIEKETGLVAERRRVASVFINRLNKSMRLQSDPTVIYGLTKGKRPLGRSLTHSDLRHPTPFNTYVIKGLPPSPITNPGRASIEAAFHPLGTKELYFVSNGKGGHTFSKSLKEHNHNVAKFRREKIITHQ